MKLDNVMLCRNGHVKLVDFGVCKHMSAQKHTFTFCGTPTHTAPEIIQAMPYNYAVDWWSMGVVLFELIVGKVQKCDILKQKWPHSYFDMLPAAVQ